MSEASTNQPDFAPPRFQFTLRQLMWFVTLFSVFCGLTASGVKLFQRERESGRAVQCQNRLQQLALGILNYEKVHGYLPPAYQLGKDGKPAHSWRLLIVQYLDLEFLYDSYDFTQPWNGPKNAGISASSWPAFQCPSGEAQDPCATSYVAIVGANTMWPGSKSAKLAKDGSDKDKILVIEIVNSDINWTEPRDLTLEEALDVIQPAKGVGVGSPHPSGIHYVTVGGDVRTLDRNIDRESLRKLLTRDVAKPAGGRVDTPRQNGAHKSL